ncbi:vacuolar protein sorting-associated protein 9 [Pyrenophora tritici-repentis]|nr:vacuolar protein sorting-associated protein 9 [Pyrenophora tritici-repentis]PZD36925.1 vacuolar protein sorting-associated protein 9 [Pyrenophora tritici-repentis]
MSPPNATPQHNAADDVTREKQLDHVAEKKHVDITAEKEPIAAPDVEPKADADDANTTAEEGRPLEAQAGVRDVEHEVNEERAVPHDMKAATEEAHDSAQQLDATANSTEREEVAKLPSAELVEQLTTATENLALGRSTPPPEPSEKAAGKAPMQSPSPPPPPPKDDKYLTASNVPSRATSPMSQGRSSGRNSEDGAAEEYTANNNDGTGDAVDNSQSEIQNIIDQFQDNEGPGEEEIMSPRLELASPMLDSPTTPYPPRRSSLVPVDKPLPTPTDDTAPKSPLQSPPPRTSSLRRVGTDTSFAEPTSPSAHASKYKPAQPVPEPEPDLPFDFHRFLEQLRHRTADPVAKFLRSFLLEFGKKQWMVHEQVKIIGDFLEFISKKMAQCEVWRTVSDAEFDNAREGMEKLVMNRLYNQTFSPAIPPPEPLSPRKGRRRQDPVGPGRRGQHQEDVERDEVLAQKVRIYKWVSEEHLDIKPVGEKGKKFLHLAQQELLKIKSYRAPRDKIICILNCCKVIFGFLRTSSSDQSADAFVPLLIYTVLQANPDHLVSNVQYILRFRNQDKLGGEAGYYISSLMGAVQFIEGLDKTSLTVTDEEFERNVEAAVSAIAEPETAGPRRSTSLKEKNRTDDDNQEQRQQQPEEENAAVAGLLRTIQRPLSTIGRIFSDTDTHPASAPTTSSSTPKPTSASALSPSSDMFPGQPSEKEKNRRSHEDASDAAARQASVEAEEARRIQRKEHRVVVETLTGMFPQLDRDVIDDVVREKEGRVGLAVDACLALANP